jgi:hypothetical protein
MTIDFGADTTTMTDTLANPALLTRPFPSDFLFGAATAAWGRCGRGR